MVQRSKKSKGRKVKRSKGRKVKRSNQKSRTRKVHGGTKTKKKLKIRKIILGPFKSELNPIGIMNPKFVSNNILNIANLNIFLIIVSPNPLSYILFPIRELYYYLYCKILIISKV